MNDLQKERSSFDQQGAIHMLAGAALAAAGTLGFIYAGNMETCISTIFSDSVQATTTIGRLPWALASTLLFTATGFLPLSMGLLPGLWFGAVTYFGGKKWCERAESVLNNVKPVRATMNLSLRKKSKWYPSFGSVACLADFEGDELQLQQLKVVIQQDAMLDLLDFEPHEVDVYLPCSQEIGPIVAVCEGHVIIAQPNDSQLVSLLLSGSASQRNSLDESGHLKAEIKGTALALIVCTTMLLFFALDPMCLTYRPGLESVSSWMFFALAPSIMLFHLLSLIKMKNALSRTSSEKAAITLEKSSGFWSWKGYGYQAVVKAGRQIETVSLDVRQCFKQDSQFCNVTVYDDIYRNQSSQEIVAVRANGNLFFRGSKSERIFSSIIPFIFPAFIAFNNFQYLNLPEQIPSGLTAEQYYKLGVRYDYKDEYSKARKALKLGIAQSHSAEETEKINRYMRCYMPVNDLSKQEVDTIDKACAKSAAGRKDEAKRMLEALIADNPRCESAHRYLAEVYISQKDIKHAEDELNKAISIRPGYVRAYILLAACRQIEGDLDGVKHYAQKALECDPTNKLARTIEICPWYSHDFW